MNKQEAIEQIRDKSERFYACDYISCNEAVGIISHIDEPQKVKIPKFVAEWLEECKSRNFSVGQAIEHVDSQRQEEIFDWFWDKGYRDNQLQFARSWLDGYEIEKEKLYTVEIPDPNRKGSNRFYLGKADNTGKVYINKGNFNPSKNKNLWLTESEIKQDFDWAWEWAEPVEEY